MSEMMRSQAQDTLSALGLGSEEYDEVTPEVLEEAENIEIEMKNSIESVNRKEMNEQKFDKTAFNFRKQLTPSELEAVVRAAPELAEQMVDNFSFIIEFGSDVLDNVNSINARLLDEQKDIELPEADIIVNGILREIDGYSAKYSDPKMKNFFEKLSKKMRGTKYNLKSMIRDAKSISDRMALTEKEIMKMEIKLRDNVSRGHELRETTIETLSDIVKVLAIFEEIIEVSRAVALKMDTAILASEAEGEDAEVIYEGEKYTVQELREMQIQRVDALGEIEKTWFAWRQKFFLYNVNVTATRNIINASFGLQRTCQRVRVDAIPAARSQLVVWQQAEQARQGAEMTERVNSGVDRLIRESAQGTAEAVKQVLDANQRSMLSEETILAVTESLKDQFNSMIVAEREGRAIRSRNLKVIQQSEIAIGTASDLARTEMLESAMEIVRADSNIVNKKDNDEILSKLGVTANKK